MRTKSRALLALGLTTTLVAAGVTAAEATGKVQCQAAVATRAVNPIEHHNQPSGESDLYSFWGNSAVANASVNYSDVAGKATTCNVPGDSAGYFSSTLLNGSNQPVPAMQSLFYYRPATGLGGPNFGPTNAFPADARLSSGMFNWSCGAGTGASATIPSCSGAARPGHSLTLHLDFPSCWDGQPISHSPSAVGDTSDDAHFRFPIGGPYGGVSPQHECPTGFPVGVPAVRFDIMYNYSGTNQGLHLSGGGSTPEGWDWNTWNQATLVSWVAQCINSSANFTAAKCDP